LPEESLPRPMNSRFRIVRWTSRVSLLGLAGVLAIGLWVTPQYLTALAGFAARETQPGTPPTSALPPEVALPKTDRGDGAARVIPAQQTPEILPVFFRAQSAEDLFAELRREGRPPAPYMEPWSQILLGRLLAIDEIVARHAAYYGTDYLGQLLAFAAESLLDPLAQGPQIDDRGIGQVGDWAESIGRVWASDPDSRYYSPDLDPERSIWDPETNIILASMLFRWVYTTPEVTTPQVAYGVYTRGHRTLRPDGSLGPEAQVRVDRAESYRERMLDFFRLKLGIGGPAQHPLTRGILEIDRNFEDGQDTYRALRDYYLDIAENPADAAMAVLLAQEALLYNDLLTGIYGEDGGQEYRRLLAALVTLEPRAAVLGDPQTVSLYWQVLARAQQRASR
jgi:hypothetical protein